MKKPKIYTLYYFCPGCLHIWILVFDKTATKIDVKTWAENVNKQHQHIQTEEEKNG